MKIPRGESELVIHLEGPDFPPDTLVEQFRQIAYKRYGGDVKIKIRMTLARDVTAGTERNMVNSLIMSELICFRIIVKWVHYSCQNRMFG